MIFILVGTSIVFALLSIFFGAWIIYSLYKAILFDVVSVILFAGSTTISILSFGLYKIITILADLHTEVASIADIINSFEGDFEDEETVSNEKDSY